MKRRKRPFFKNILNHCYLRTRDDGVIFYSYSDYLVWFTIVCTEARKRRVKILSLCAMPDHVHMSVTSAYETELSGFMRDWSKEFSRQHNITCHLSGPLFASPFGSAPKFGAKKGRTNLIYVGNNPVDRQLVDKAEDYRWNFLAYAESDHPFSRKLVLREARWHLRQAVKEVKAQFKAGKPMTYAALQRLFKPLSTEECQQLTDFIISTYNVIDYAAALSFFNSYEDMMTAMHSNTGSEYDINEVFIGKSDAHYATMAAIVLRELQPEDIHDMLALSGVEKFKVFQLIRKYSMAPSEQIAKFLHLPLKRGPIEEN